MADIGWAAHWIKEGRVVKRAAWPYEQIWDGLRASCNSNERYLLGHTGLNYEDLTAEDWEFAPDQPPTH